MSTRQPNFRQRIRLLQIAAEEASAIAELLHREQFGSRLREVANIIDAEVARMERAAERWEHGSNAKTAPTGTALPAHHSKL